MRGIGGPVYIRDVWRIPRAIVPVFCHGAPLPGYFSTRSAFPFCPPFSALLPRGGGTAMDAYQLSMGLPSFLGEAVCGRGEHAPYIRLPIMDLRSQVSVEVHEVPTQYCNNNLLLRYVPEE